MIRRPPRSTQSRSSAASDVYKRQAHDVRRRGGAVARPRRPLPHPRARPARRRGLSAARAARSGSPRLGGGGLSHRVRQPEDLSLIHISEPTRLGMISYAVFCLKKKKKIKK